MNGSAVTDNGDDSTDGVTFRQAKCSRYITRTRVNVHTHQFADAEDSSITASGLGCSALLPFSLYLFLSLSRYVLAARDGFVERERVVQ